MKHLYRVTFTDFVHGTTQPQIEVRAESMEQAVKLARAIGNVMFDYVIASSVSEVTT